MSGREDFDALLVADPEESAEPESARGRGRLWLAVSVGAAVTGALVVAACALAASLPSGIAVAADTPTPAVATPVAAEPAASPAPDAAFGITALPDHTHAAALAARTGIPLRVLLAYLGATLQVATESPGCGLGWNTLAGVGSVESDHGTFGGSVISDAGDAMPAIVGIALDGGDTAVIRDTDGGVFDGDTVWDRAVGPMQFIPSTWAEWGADGNGDGVADPQNIDDAALAAGRYLCAAGGDLTEPDGWITAIAAYNDAVEYNNRVAEAATAYASVAE